MPVKEKKTRLVTKTKQETAAIVSAHVDGDKERKRFLGKMNYAAKNESDEMQKFRKATLEQWQLLDCCKLFV